MKKKLTALILVLLLVCALLPTGAMAASSDATQTADKLNAMGLFKGTNSGYELDRAPNRAEALVMLIRLLGEEQAALNGYWPHPFTDAGWAEQYIGYAYETGLTKGMSSTYFGATEAASSDMFITFVLRALGYSDTDGDFTYADSEVKAAEIGLIGSGEYTGSGSFLRGDCVLISYSALSLKLKGTNATLIQDLANRYAVHSHAAVQYGLPVDISAIPISSGAYSDDEIVDYFLNTAFGSEYGESIEQVTKWTTPIKCYVCGEYTAADMAFLKDYAAACNAIPGFPGLTFVSCESDSNMYMEFFTSDEMYDYCGEYCQGRATIWWNNGNITDADVYITTDDQTQYERNTVIMEEITQSFGLLTDTYTYPESLFYQGFTSPQWPADIDWALVKLLYSPEMTVGLTRAHAAKTAYALLAA